MLRLSTRIGKGRIGRGLASTSARRPLQRVARACGRDACDTSALVGSRPGQWSAGAIRGVHRTAAPLGSDAHARLPIDIQAEARALWSEKLVPANIRAMGPLEEQNVSGGSRERVLGAVSHASLRA